MKKNLKDLNTMHDLLKHCRPNAVLFDFIWDEDDAVMLYIDKMDLITPYVIGRFARVGSGVHTHEERYDNAYDCRCAFGDLRQEVTI